MTKRKNAGRPISPDAITGFEDLHNPVTRDPALVTLGQWVIDTCLMFGCQPETAYEIAITFTRGLRKEIEL
jgi:hypothetical protein